MPFLESGVSFFLLELSWWSATGRAHLHVHGKLSTTLCVLQLRAQLFSSPAPSPRFSHSSLGHGILTLILHRRGAFVREGREADTSELLPCSCHSLWLHAHTFPGLSHCLSWRDDQTPGNLFVQQPDLDKKYGRLIKVAEQTFGQNPAIRINKLCPLLFSFAVRSALSQ